MAAQMSSMAESSAIPLDDLSERWDRFELGDPDEIVESVLREYADQQDARRDLLISWLAFQLGYSRYLHRREGIESRPLWDLLDRAVFERVGSQGERAIFLVAQATGHPMRSALHPKSAVAAVALWRNARTPAVRDEARRLLREHPLPNRDWWLYRLVGRFTALGAVRSIERPGLFDLAALQLGSQFWEIAAKLGAFYFARRYLAVRSAPEPDNLVVACDRASELYSERERDWLALLAEAARAGSLRYSWLEKPVAATLRNTIGEADVHERYRSYHRRRLYRADHARLADLYEHLLEAAVRSEGPTRIWARRRLLEELARTAEHNPKRALNLAELIAVHEHPLRLGTFRHRLRHALRQIESKPELDLLDVYLAGLYVATYDIEPYALQYVHRVADRIDWSEHPVADGRKLELYLKVSDYESAFENLTFEIDGTTLGLEDKDASLRVLYFFEKRFEPTSFIRFLRRSLAPVEWLGSTLKSADSLEETAERGIELFRAWLERRDLRHRVVREYATSGVSVANFDEIADMGADFIGEHVVRLRNQRLVAAAGAGLFAGVAGPVGSPGLALADIPAKLALGLEAGALFCWYYGFDPREHPEMPLEILAVALDGPRPRSMSPVRLQRSLAEFAIQTSFFVEAVGTRSLGRIVGRTLRGLIEEFSDSGYGDSFAALMEHFAISRLEATAAERRSIPFWGAILGAVVDAAFVYDVCESAQAVLTDRFLARKYPEWDRKLGQT